MKETAQQYIQRITAHIERKQPLAVQAATARKLERVIKGVPTSKLAGVLLLTNGRSMRSSHISLTRKSSSAFV